MYGLPLNADVSFLKGQRLIQVCFGRNDLILNFEQSEPVSLLVMSSIGCMSPDGALRKVVEFKDAAEFILSLVGRVVSSVRVLEGGTLDIVFENNCCIQIYDDDSHFESYTIQHSGKLIVV